MNRVWGVSAFEDLGLVEIVVRGFRFLADARAAFGAFVNGLAFVFKDVPASRTSDPDLAHAPSFGVRDARARPLHPALKQA